ncbi:MAG: IS3 family transposase [Granulosicoccus sp.]
MTEGFFATIKKELIHKYKITTRHEAAAAIFESIEAFYNRFRETVNLRV